MATDLTTSNIHRQNVLNNHFALQKIEEYLSFGGIKFQGESFFIKQQVASLFNVDARTIDRYINSYGEELVRNGYTIVKGKNLKDFIGLLDVDDINVVDMGRIPQLGIFSFKSVLNLAMLLTESDTARTIRSKILDIVIDVIAQKAGGHTKYINQLDEDYLPSAFQEEGYRKQFTNALGEYVEIKSKWDYGRYTNIIYQNIFAENAREYRKILNLSQSDNVRDTMYSEVIDLIASFEAGLADTIKQESLAKNRKLTREEADRIFANFSSLSLFKPLITKARTLMASRDLCFRDALHEKLKHYIREVPEADYERFLSEKSKALQERIEESLDVYKRLKDR